MLQLESAAQDLIPWVMQLRLQGQLAATGAVAQAGPVAAAAAVAAKDGELSSV